jgi:hypothetical protein
VRGFLNVHTTGVFRSDQFVFSLIGVEHMQWTVEEKSADEKTTKTVTYNRDSLVYEKKIIKLN